MEETKIHAKAVVEILGTPKEHVEETMKMVMGKAKDNYNLISETTYAAEEIEGLWSTFADLEVDFKSMDQLIGFCFDFMPSSIEIIEPMQFSIKCTDMANLLNDLLAKLHRYDMIVKNLNAENIILKKKWAINIF